MKARLFNQVILSAIIIAIIGIISIIGLAVLVSSRSESYLSQNSLQPPGASLSTSTPAITPASATTSLVAATLTITTPANSPLIVNNPTNVAVGEIIKLPDLLYSKGGGFSLSRTDKPPVLSVDQALDYNAGATWEKGGFWEGKQITVTVTFGSGSLGRLQADGSWVPAFSPPEFKCTAIRKCTPTGKSLDRIENRPMWIIDYAGLESCGSGPCDNHTVFLIDDATGTLFYGFGYSTS